MSAAELLTVGDRVSWRGAWGSQPAMVATVRAVERTPARGTKYGDPVQSMPWSEVADHAVVTLDNGCWAYGYQLSPLPVEVAQ